MHLITRRPSPPLDLFVETLWWSRRDAPWVDCEHILPTGTAQLIITLHDQPIAWRAPGNSAWNTWRGGVVHGPQSSFYIAGPKPTGALMGVAFRPAAAALLGAPLSELTDRHITLDALWGTRAQQLRERLMEARDADSALQLLEGELMSRIRRPLLVHPAVAYALEAKSSGDGSMLVRDVQQETGYSARHFIELFRSHVGLTPKHYYRLRRFSRLLRGYAKREATLSQLAALLDYSDQSHLTREFREFAGVAPTRYCPRSPTSPHHHVQR